MKKFNLLFIAFFALYVGFSQSTDNTATRFAKIITTEDAKKHLSILASDEYEGRETGKAGQKKAARYIAEDFKSIGLKPTKDNNYFQKFPLTLSTPDSVKLKVNGKNYEMIKDFYVLPYGKDLKLDAKEILFLGYGISDSLYSDYKNADVKNKIVLVLGGEPMSEDSVSFVTGTKELSDWATNYRMKADLARKNGASALIVISANYEGNLKFVKRFLESPSMRLAKEKTTEKDSDEKEERKKIPQIGISSKTANDILAYENKTVDELKKKIRTSKKSFSFEMKSPFELEINNKEDTLSSENVLGMIEGTEFKDEVIFVTGHYDHLGVRDGKVYNGADDDGSGTTGVLEIANAFMKAKEAGFAPKRTLVFMTVAGEEKGLLGSSYYTDHPIFPIANTVCDLNIDMIGRIDDDHKKDSAYVYLIGSDKISTELHKINENANATYTKLKLEYKYNDPNDPNRFYYRSDHYNFAKKGIPIIFYFNGVHDDYHQPTDKVAKINFDLLAKRAQLVFYTAWEVANRKNRIKSDVPQEKSEGK